jgi:uncharacterized membrane protein
MIKVAAALNSFASESEATAPPSEEIFVLSASQLEAIISQAVERATAPLATRLDALERGVGCGKGGEDPQDGQESQISAWKALENLWAENLALKRELEAFQDHVAQERAFDRQRIAKLEQKAPQPLQKDRGDILRALIAANGGKMLAKEARRKMHLSKSRFSELLATMEGYIEMKSFHGDKRSKVLLLK